MKTPNWSAGLLCATAFAVVAAAGAQAPMEGPTNTTAVVNVQTKGGGPVTPSMLKVEVNGHATPIDSLQPLRQAGAQIAILIDDGLRGSASLQFQDLKQFITQLPEGTPVLVGYMANGTVRSNGFTTDHAAAAGQVRVPMSVAGMSGSPYFCLSEFVKHWPASQPGARVVLMITNGVDPYNESTSIMNQDSPYVQTAQEDAQRAGVTVYALYYGDAGMRGGRANLSGQNYLSQITEATGGESLYTGEFNPPSFAPYLQRLMNDLRESYLIGFQANASHRNMDRLKVSGTEPGVKVHAPMYVQAGSNE